ncbi:MAG: MerR family transcriptional regulator [Stenotrophomonas nitritireducens]|uniref:hypothetical protein n=1 Tax=Stenotrophomonas nitritireducens TaxID=83617 RepID=UPI001AC6D431|nr:hypothetical protein [Stenotrophomonas nitritireducens]MBN8791020.1 MerR family transcriptional regulator [Stenotrophomonas nitritireducens]MBN8796592.1 MerR family transcriptional regulator [Stenotrophomonas nitritireducens]
MRYLPAQAKESLGISEETFRHWRRALPPLQGRKGYGPCFTPGDLLALKVVAQLHTLGIQVRHITRHADALFDACSQSAWFGLSDKVIAYGGDSVSITGVSEARHPTQACVLVPLRPLIAELRQALSNEETVPAQSDIAFPPMRVGTAKSA